MNTPLSFEQRLSDSKKQITGHPLYRQIKTSGDLHQFMRFHVYAVWDFMSLLKHLQTQLTCCSVPWFPVGNAQTRYLINEIVTGEESDELPDGSRISHFELYLRAMQHAGADTREIETFLQHLQQSGRLEEAFEAAGTPEEARAFVRFTFGILEEGKIHRAAAIFTYGREDLIPEMFLQIIEKMPDQLRERFSLFQYYLQRHIEIDGGHHGQLSVQMVELLCAEESKKWEDAEEAIHAALAKRAELWNGVLHALGVAQN